MVRLRAEVDGADRRYLDAYLTEDGDLLISGQDLGPATAVVSSDGEYESQHRIVSELLPEFRAAPRRGARCRPPRRARVELERTTSS